MEREERTGLEFVARKEKKKKKHKGKENKDELGGASSLIQVCGDQMGKVVEGENCDDKGEAYMNSGEGAGKKKKKKRKREKNGDDTVVNNVSVEDGNRDVEAVNGEDGQKRKKKRAESEKHVNIEDSNRDIEAVNVEDGKKRNKKKAKSEKHVNVEDGKGDMEAVNVEDGKERKKKRAKSEKHVNVEDDNRDVEAVNVEDGKLMKNEAESEELVLEDINRDMETVNVEDANRRKKKKKKKAKAEKHVHIEDCNKNTEAVNVEAVNIEDNKKKNASDVVVSQSDGPSDEHQGLVRGKRFSEEEDEILREAVFRYIEERGLGADGLDMVLHCRSHPKVIDCWKVIGEAIPLRPSKSVYYRAHVLFERAEKPTWTPEEYEEVKKFYREHGTDWKALGDKLGKHRIHVKDAWRRLKLPNHRKGPWSQEEYQTLSDLVNKDLLMRALEKKKTKHGMLRDNICWEAISDKLGTRTNAVCSMKWYKQLASPLVKQKLWAGIDDYRLLDALTQLEASSIEDVDWDDLLEHRPGDVCRRRWDQMVKHIGEHALESFPEQVAVLSKRYPAELIEAIETYDSKPVVD
ncbi:hypothetical protein ABKV19_020062 [Rosa sericea]